MFYLIRRFRPDVLCLKRHFKKKTIFLPSRHNLKLYSTVDTLKYSICVKTELSLSEKTVNKFIKYVIEEFKNGEPSNDQLISEHGYKEISRLIESRSIVEESLKSFEDLVKQDPEMKELGKEEYESYENELKDFDEQLLNCLFRSLGHESCNDVIFEITTGVGGQESMIFVKDLLEMYLGYIRYLGFGYEILHMDTAGVSGIRHVSIAVSGEKAMDILRHESGVHRVQRIPATERSGRVHTSTVSVAIIPQPSDIEVDLKDKDLKIETKKASGAGGQHVNTTDSAVRITHLPTGISVESQTDRSQIKNRRIAMIRLKALIYKKQLDEQRTTSSEMRKKQLGLGLRNEKIRTYNFNQDRITDHRISDGTLHNLKGFLEGGEILWELQKKLQRDLQLKILEEAVRKVLK